MGIIKNLGFIAEAQHYPCASPAPELVIIAAAQAGAITLMQAVSFSCLDIIKMRAGISPWHARGMKALIEGAIPGEQIDAVKKIYKFAIPVEQGLFFFFVVDLTVDFFANWQSQLFKLKACGNRPNDSTATGPMSSFATAGNNKFDPIGYAMAWVGPVLGASTGFFVPRGYFFQCAFSLQVRPIFVGQSIGSLTTRLRLQSAVDFSITSEAAHPGWFGNPVRQGQAIHPNHKAGVQEHWVFEAATDVPSVGIAGALSLYISDRPLHEEGLLPVNCFGNIVGEVKV